MKRLPVNGAAVGVVALAVGALGTAVAADKITSDEIKNKTILAADQADESTNGRVVKDGSLGRKELKEGARNSLAVPGRVPPGKTLRGAVGGDFHVYSEASDDFGVDVSLPVPARSLLTDDDVHIVVTTWADGGGQTQPTTDDTNAGCTGTIAKPTAPDGDVCVYVTGGDNAQNVNGYSVIPGTGGSRYGFKVKWDPAVNGDTFIDAVWAYNAGP